MTHFTISAIKANPRKKNNEKPLPKGKRTIEHKPSDLDQSNGLKKVPGTLKMEATVHFIYIYIANFIIQILNTKNAMMQSIYILIIPKTISLLARAAVALVVLNSIFFSFGPYFYIIPFVSATINRRTSTLILYIRIYTYRTSFSNFSFSVLLTSSLV